MAEIKRFLPEGVSNKDDATQCPVVLALRCQACDAGDGIETVEAATSIGWTCIGCDHGGLSWNHMGLCPDCEAEGA